MSSTKLARVSNGAVVIMADRDAIPAEQLAGWIECPDSTKPGDRYEDGAFVSARPLVWTRSEFLDRVDQVAPGAWDAFIAAKDSGNPIAKQVYERGWVPHTEIEQRNPKTVEMTGALVAIGILTPEQVTAILNP